MQILLVIVEMDTSFCRSLKEKRSIIRPVKDKLKNNFNLSVCEKDNFIYSVMINDDVNLLIENKNKITNFLENSCSEYIVDINTHIIQLFDNDFES